MPEFKRGDGDDLGASGAQAEPGAANGTSLTAMNGHGVNGSAHTSAASFPTRSKLRAGQTGEVQDLICVGFGPASLAIAVALQDALTSATPPDIPRLRQRSPKVLFLERQRRFAWHAGMLLPGAKMQISFIKDLATLRDPRSEFTFMNYLHKNNRLVQFSNLGTFLPLRLEYEDYMRWCATAFDDAVEYGQQVLDVTPDPEGPSGKIESFTVRSRQVATGDIVQRSARHVVIAVGGRPHIPKSLPQHHPRVIHSSRYSTALPELLGGASKPYRIAVIGGGQSAAEIFNDLKTRYPMATTILIIKGGALRPSDDSPFVNEIFDPQRVGEVYSQAPDAREASIAQDRGTNYGVVRLELLDHIYADMYAQRLLEPIEELWRRRIMSDRYVERVEDLAGGRGARLHIRRSNRVPITTVESPMETLDVDAVLVATGYVRDAHEELLLPAKALNSRRDNCWGVRRDYRVQLDPDRVSESAGVWLQGCNESTHGLSDTLLSVLATRGHELVESIFGGPTTAGGDR